MDNLKAQDLLHYHLTFRNVFKDILRPDKTPISEFEILLLIEETEGIKVGELSKIMSITRPNLTPLVENLFNKGFITRKQDEKDKRVIRLYITDTGKAKIRENLEIIEKRMDVVKQKYSNKELAMIKEYCDKLEKILNK